MSILLTNKSGGQEHHDGAGRVGTADEAGYLTVMIEGIKHFFRLDPDVALTTDFTQLPPGAQSRRAAAAAYDGAVSRTYKEYLAARQRRNASTTTSAAKRPGLWRWADDVSDDDDDDN